MKVSHLNLAAKPSYKVDILRAMPRELVGIGIGIGLGRIFTHSYNNKNCELDQCHQIQIPPPNNFDFFQTHQKCSGRSDCVSFVLAMDPP